MLAFRSPRTTGSLPWKRFSKSSKSGRWSRVDGGRYSPISDIRWSPSTSSQLPNLGPWKRIDSTIHPSVFSRDMIPTTPCVTPTAVTVALDQKSSYPRRLRQYIASIIFVSVRNMRLYFPCSTAQIAWGSLNPLPYQMFYVPRLIPMGRGAGAMAVAASSAGSHFHSISVGWNITIFSSCLLFPLRSP